MNIGTDESFQSPTITDENQSIMEIDPDHLFFDNCEFLKDDL